MEVDLTTFQICPRHVHYSNDCLHTPHYYVRLIAKLLNIKMIKNGGGCVQ